jgi:hypothetical protein
MCTNLEEQFSSNSECRLKEAIRGRVSLDNPEQLLGEVARAAVIFRPGRGIPAGGRAGSGIRRVPKAPATTLALMPAGLVQGR